MITWNIDHGTPLYFSAMAEAFGSGALVANSATTTGFTIQHGGNTVFFDGIFTIDALGILTGGTISAFHVYIGATHLLDASGYAIDLGDLLSGSVVTQAGQNLLVEVPKIINGSPEDDIVPGGSMNDQIFGKDGNDRIYGAFDDDFISGGAGMDTLVGGDALAITGDGTDTVDYSEKTGSLVITLTGDVTTTVTVNGIAEDTIIEFENANGGSGNDRITGGNVANRLVGNGGDDILDGELGADTLIGGLGNDAYVVDNLGDIVTEAAGEGNDTVTALVAHELGANVENLTLVGDSTLTGIGNGLANVIHGNSGASLIRALDGDDSVDGDAGDDTIAGGLGLDSLTGGTGSDTFVFDVAVTKVNADQITDFVVGLDQIGLDSDLFGRINDSGALKAKFFHIGKHATDGNDFIIENKKTGALFYDQDGSGHAFKQVKFATVYDHDAHHPKLAADDFLIV